MYVTCQMQRKTTQWSCWSGLWRTAVVIVVVAVVADGSWVWFRCETFWREHSTVSPGERWIEDDQRSATNRGLIGGIRGGWRRIDRSVSLSARTISIGRKIPTFRPLAFSKRPTLYFPNHIATPSTLYASERYLTVRRQVDIGESRRSNRRNSHLNRIVPSL